MKPNSVKVNMTPAHPGSFIRVEIIEELGFSVEKAAEMLDVPRQALSDLLNGAVSLSSDMAQRIETSFGADAKMLLQMQAWYDTSNRTQFSVNRLLNSR